MKISSQSFLRFTKKKLLTLKNDYLDDYIFIHINKNGGTSISQALRIPQEHYTAFEKRSRVGQRSWNKKITFSVVRNPWDRIVSMYCYRIKTNQTELHRHKLSFEEWLRFTLVDKDPVFYDKPKMFMPQFDWLVDENSDLIVSNLLRFESLSDDFQDFTTKLGLSSIALPHVNKTNRSSYSSYFTSETKDIVENFYLKDINAFGYAFDE